MFEQKAGRDVRKRRLAYRHRHRNAIRSTVLIAIEPSHLRSSIPKIEKLDGYRKELLTRVRNHKVVC